MHSIQIAHKAYTLPEFWDELSSEGWRTWVMMGGFRKGDVRRVRMVATTLQPVKGKRNQKAINKMLQAIDPCALLVICGCMDWMLEPAEAAVKVVPRIPGFWFHGQWWQFPRHSLMDMTVDEWEFLSQLHELYVKNQSADLLRNMTAVMARPLRSKRERQALDYDGYARQPFNRKLVDTHTELLRDAPPWVHLAASDYVYRCGQMLPLRYKAAFEGPKSKGPQWGLRGLVMAVAEDGTYGPEKSVRQMNIHDFYQYVSRKAQQAEIQRREAEKAKGPISHKK